MRNQRLLYVFAVLATALPGLANAATVTETTTSRLLSYEGRTATFSFADLPNADELVSVSRGGVIENFNGHGAATLKISADYADGSSTLITSQTYPAQIGEYDFTISPTSFAGGTIDGLTFTFGGTYGDFRLNSGTTFTFDVAPPITPPAAPEPATWVTMLAGFGAVGAALRFRPQGTGLRRVG